MSGNPSRSAGGGIDPGAPWQIELLPSGLGFIAQLGAAAALRERFSAPPARLAASGMAVLAAALIAAGRPLTECAQVLALLPWASALAAPTSAPLVEGVALLLRAEHTQATAAPLELWAHNLSEQRLVQLDGPFAQVLAACTSVMGCHTPHRWHGSAWCSAGWAGLAAESSGAPAGSGGRSAQIGAPRNGAARIRIGCRFAHEAPTDARRAAWRAWESAPLSPEEPGTIVIDWPGQPDDPAPLPGAFALGAAAGRAWLEANAP